VPRGPRRLHAAAVDAWFGGDPAHALALLGDAEAAQRAGADRDEVTAAQVELLRAQIMLRCDNVTDAYETLLAAATRFEPHSIQLATRAHVAAGMAAWFAGDLRRFGQAAERASEVVGERADELAPTVRLGLHYLTGLAAQFAGRTEEAAGPLKSVVDAALVVNDPSALVLAAGCAMSGGGPGPGACAGHARSQRRPRHRRRGDHPARHRDPHRVGLLERALPAQ
jgi:hypothetical protein